MNAPIPFVWNGDAMVAPARFARLCDKQFAVGEVYPLIVHEDRSTNSHNHFFAAVHEAWKNLPERLTARYPTSDHLRKWALIKAGYADERSIACPTAEEALRVAAFIKPMDDYAIIVVADTTIKVFTAKSQSARAMDKKTFQESKQAVLDIAAELIGVDVATLAANSAGATGLESAASLNSSRESRVPTPEMKPAPEMVPPVAGAGAPSSSAAESGMAPAGEPKQAGDGGNPLVSNVTGLPEGWRVDYANALRKALKFPSLPKKAAEFWEPLGTWAAHKNGPDAETAVAIYRAFEQHFPDHEKRDAILRELGATQ